MSDVLDGLQGFQNLMDDVLIYESTREEHDNRFKAGLERLAQSGVTLNTDKCQLGVTRLSLLGVVPDQDCIRADPRKVNANKLLPPPTNVSEL